MDKMQSGYFSHMVPLRWRSIKGSDSERQYQYQSSDTDDELMKIAKKEVSDKFNVPLDKIQYDLQTSKEIKFNPLVQYDINPNEIMIQVMQHSDKSTKLIELQFPKVLTELHTNINSWKKNIFQLNGLFIDLNINHYYDSDSEHDSEWEWLDTHRRTNKTIKKQMWAYNSDTFQHKRKSSYTKRLKKEWKRLIKLRNKFKSELHPNFRNRMYVLDIHFIGIQPRIYRRIKVPSHLSLAVLHDKILTPLFGFKRNFHAYQFRRRHCKNKRISYGPRYAKSVDMMHIDPVLGSRKLGQCMLDAQFIRLNDVLININDELRYDYDIGDYYGVRIRLTNISEIGINETRLIHIVDGQRSGPPENMDCNRGWVEKLNFLKNYEFHICDQDIKNLTKFYETIYEIRNSPNTVNRKHMFNPERFNKKKCVKKIRKYFKTILSKQNAPSQLHPINGFKRTDRQFILQSKFHYTPRTCHNSICNKLSGKPFERSDWDILQDKKYKVCSRCLSAFYCSRPCQKLHWNMEHRFYCFDHSKII
eukprot:385645_1